MRFGILGPLAVWQDDGRELPLGAAKPRSLLALLLLRRAGPARSETLIDELWEERAPPTAASALHTYVSQLRRVLGEDRIETRHGGYLLRVDPEELDAERFEQLLDRARTLRAEGDASDARDALREALALWRGPPFADLRYERFAQDEIARLEELRARVLEQRLDAELELGLHADAVPELEALVRTYPLRERLRELHMLALYRSGRPPADTGVGCSGGGSRRRPDPLAQGRAAHARGRTVRADHEPADVALVGKHVGNYEYHPQYGVLLDQLWVR